MFSGIYVYVSNIDSRSLGRSDGRNHGSDEPDFDSFSCYIFHIVSFVCHLGKRFFGNLNSLWSPNKPDKT